MGQKKKNCKTIRKYIETHWTEQDWKQSKTEQINYF